MPAATPCFSSEFTSRHRLRIVTCLESFLLYFHNPKELSCQTSSDAVAALVLQLVRTNVLACLASHTDMSFLFPDMEARKHAIMQQVKNELALANAQELLNVSLCHLLR
jgi:hypothetical protein